MLRIAVIEDEPTDFERLSLFVQNYIKENNLPEVEIVHFTLSSEFLKRPASDFDVVFMDILLPDGNGMDIAKLWRNKGAQATLIFVTNMTQYAIKGYEVGAIGYLVKPIDEFTFRETFEKAYAIYKDSQSELLLANNGTGIAKIQVRDLFYIEVMNHTLYFHCRGGTVEARGRMKDEENNPILKDFARCNNSYLVNLNYVDEIKNNEVLICGERLPISRPKRHEFFNIFTRFCGRQ